MKFNSQICTTQEQSERLLSLGLKKETADCRICPFIVTPNQYFIMDMGTQPLDKDETPAWSLHRLIELSDMGIMDSSTDNIYDKIIHYIEFLIKCGDFNKEYLEVNNGNKKDN